MSPRLELKEVDRLRLVALGRIPRCGSCPRYRALRAAHRAGKGVSGCMPAAPAACTPMRMTYSPPALLTLVADVLTAPTVALAAKEVTSAALGFRSTSRAVT